ncbi:MAG: transposase family protein [Hungatella sp.]|jgi:transposase|nr:transposase family protein [Hungatella sp.]
MDEIIKLLDLNLNYVSHEICGDTVYITVVSNRSEVTCPFCGQISSKVHSHYQRTCQDLPIQNKKVILVLNDRKMFCKNFECNHTTFAEDFSFLKGKAKKTNRLKDEIIRLSLSCSAIATAEILRRNVVQIGRSTVSNL